MTTIEEIGEMGEFAIESGIIRTPGKFEGEARYAPYFYEAYLNGFATDQGFFTETDAPAGPEEEGPVQGDYIIEGNCLSVFEGHSSESWEFHGEDYVEEMEDFIRNRMEEEQFWPSVWHCSDHGNLALTTI